MGFLNVLSQSGSESEHLEEYQQVAATVQQEGFKCVKVGKIKTALDLFSDCYKWLFSSKYVVFQTPFLVWLA